MQKDFIFEAHGLNELNNEKELWQHVGMKSCFRLTRRSVPNCEKKCLIKAYDFHEK